MNGYIKIVLLLIINLLSFKIAGFWLGIVVTCIIIYRILTILGIFRSPILYRAVFKDGISYTKDYLGLYSKQKKEFIEAAKLIETYKLKNFVVIAFYYDNPDKVEDNKLRSSIGIYRKNSKDNETVPEDFEKFCETHGYNKNELPKEDCLYSNWDYFNTLSMIIGYIKFYKLLNNKLKDDFFKKQFRVDEKKIKVTIEVYESHNKYMSFYVPLNGDSFMIFKKDK